MARHVAFGCDNFRHFRRFRDNRVSCAFIGDDVGRAGGGRNARDLLDRSRVGCIDQEQPDSPL
jgi:hypothetical protein